MSDSQNKRKAQFLEAFKRSACNISEACKKAGIARKTFYFWVDDDEEFAERVEEIQEGMIDFAESKLIQNINEGKETSLIFFLKTKAKKRGYIEGPERTTDTQVTDLNITIKHSRYAEEGEST